MNGQPKDRRRWILRLFFSTVLIIGVPLVFLFNGTCFYVFYSTANLLAFFPALTFTDCLLIALPLAVWDYVFNFLPHTKKYRTVPEMRKLIREIFTD